MVRPRFKKSYKADPEQRAFKYKCLSGHIRIERVKLPSLLPICLACEKEGRQNRFSYIGRYTIPKSQLKKKLRF